MGFRLKEQKGPRRAPHPWSQRVGDLTWEPSRLPGLEWVRQFLSAPLPLLPEGLSRLPLLNSPQPPSYAPRPGGRVALEGRGPGWELSRLPGPEWVGQMPSIPLPLLPDISSHLPLLISLASGAPILSGLQFSPQLCPPTSYWFTWGFLPFPWVRVPHQQPAGALVVERC